MRTSSVKINWSNLLGQARRSSGLDLHQQVLSAMMNRQVGQHPPLLSEIGRVHALASVKRLRRRWSPAPGGNSTRRVLRIGDVRARRLSIQPAAEAIMRY